MTALADTLAIAADDLNTTYTTAVTAAGADADRQGPAPDAHEFTLSMSRSDTSPYPYIYMARILWGNSDVEPFYVDGSVNSLAVSGDTPTHFILRALIYCLKINGY